MAHDRSARSPDTKFAHALARAFGGAIIFGLPIHMTMEMWSLGAGMPSIRLVLLLASAVPLLIGLSAVSGFERTFRFKHDALDAFVALAVGIAAALLILTALGIINPALTLREATGMVTLQAIPGSIGALLAASQFGPGGPDGDDDTADHPSDYVGYKWEMFLMVVGALFLAFNIAPTEEVTLLAMRMSPWHTIAAIVLSLGLMHAFVYAVEFSGQATVSPGTPFLSVFLRYTIPGYAIVLVVAAYILWSFGRLDGLRDAEMVSVVVALGVPAAIGGAAARLLL